MLWFCLVFPSEPCVTIWLLVKVINDRRQLKKRHRGGRGLYQRIWGQCGAYWWWIKDIETFDKWAYVTKRSLVTWPCAPWVSHAHRDLRRPAKVQLVNSAINSNTVSHTCCAFTTLSVSPAHHTHSRSVPPPPSLLSCGCVLAMIHLTRQHFIRAFRENRGFCHFPESFTLPGAGSTPLASPSRLPSTTLPSAWREGKEGERERVREGGEGESSGRYGN